MTLLGFINRLKKFDGNAEVKIWNKEIDEYYKLIQVTTEAKVTSTGQKMHTVYFQVVSEDS